MLQPWQPYAETGQRTADKILPQQAKRREEHVKQPLRKAGVRWGEGLQGGWHWSFAEECRNLRVGHGIIRVVYVGSAHAHCSEDRGREEAPCTASQDAKATVELSPELNCMHTHSRNPDLWLKKKSKCFVEGLDLDGKMLNNQNPSFSFSGQST